MEAQILTVKALNKNYGELRALRDVTFDVRHGEIVGLLGHNGAGKSTLIKCLMGAIRSYTGSIRVSGIDIYSKQRMIREQVGFLLEPSFCDYLSARENLELLNSVTAKPDPKRVQEVLETVSLKRFADKKVGEFSFGMRQRLGLAQVLLTRPRLIVLDEPTVGLDPLGVEIIKDIMLECSRSGIAVLFSSHQLSDVLDICHRAVVMNEGRVVYNDLASELNKKFFVLHLDRAAEEHAEILQRVVPELTVTENVVRFSEAEALNDVLRYLQRRGLRITDIECEVSMDRLKKLMQS